MALERVVDPRRLARGRSYARHGQVLTLEIEPGLISARVQGSRTEPYRVTIQIPVLTDAEWDTIADSLTEQAIYGAHLLAGQMPTDIEEVFTAVGADLFPSGRRALNTTCTCPDWVEPCKHAAAVCYLVGERFDEDPFLMFQLRGRSRAQITEALRARRTVGSAADVETQDETFSSQAALDSPELEGEALLERFWAAPAEIETLGMSFEEPDVAALPIKRLGPPPFASDGAKFVREMERAYQLISDEARRLVVEDE